MGLAMETLKRILLAGGATLALAAAAQAADAPTEKAPPPAPAANCFASVWTWLDSTANDCPLSMGPFTVYGQVDVGFGYETAGAAFNKYWLLGVEELIGRQSKKAMWQLVPNGLSQSNLGVKFRQPLIGDISLIGDLNFGFDPYSLQFANGPASLHENNTTPQYWQTSSGDSSRAGLIDNGRAYLGLASPTYGTLTAGRQLTFADTVSIAYDSMAGAYAFGLTGNPLLVLGTGITETARYNTSVEYVYDYNHLVHAGALVQVGGWEELNASQSAYQFDVGGNYAGFSFDAVYAYDKDAIALSAYGGPLPAGVAPNDLKATLADLDAFALFGKYTWGQLTLYGGYLHERFTNPSDTSFPNGIPEVAGGYAVAPNSVYPGSINTTAYTIPKIQQVAWGGAKYALRSDLDIAAAYYEAWQNNYSGSTCVANTVTVPGAPLGTHQGTNTPYNNNTLRKAVGNCAGNEPAVAFLVDYRPFKRVDTYAGINYSGVTGGMAAGYIKSSNTAFTTGVRLSF
jgi:predicted porin